MLTIRMQRLGRKGHPTYRVVVQDVRQTPTSGKYIALLGSYDPHTRTSTLIREKAEFYLSNGAQPSARVVSLFKAEGVTMPAWVKQEHVSKTRGIRNPEKLRKNRPAEPASEEVVADSPTDEAPLDESTAENTPAQEASESNEASEESSEK